MRLSYLDPLPNVTASLEFVQGEEVIDSTEVSIYSCSLLAADCSSCVYISSLWSCSWCSGRCSHECPQPAQEVVCDRPLITSFSPSSGPMEGGTEVTIHGRDLGSTIEDVRDRVFVAGSRCTVISYEISKKIVCRVEKGTGSGPIRVTIGKTSSRAAESVMLYSFVEVTVFSVYPVFAPVSGGTKITLYGQNLDAGSNATVRIGDVPCDNIIRNSTSSLTCTVARSSSTKKSSKISVKIDGAVMDVPGVFEFRPDPSVSTIYPLISFKSGGRAVTVEGANFDSVTSARMYFVSSTSPPFEVVSKASSCQIQNATFMFCLTPELLPGLHSRTAYARFPVGFAMENVTSVQNLGHRIQMRVVPDPEFAPFKGIRIHQGDQPLILDGSHLNEAAEPQDYKIYIGSERCYVTLVDSRQLVCTGPQNQPEATDERGNLIAGGLPLVSVTVGRIRSELGLIEYVDPIATLRLWVLVVTALTALCSVLVLLAFLWKKRRAERERDYRKIQMQMEHLESNVRKECKQAFAELQTTMESCGDDEYEGMDVTTFPEFLHRLLWEDNSWTNSTSLYASTLPVTLAQFDALLSSKQFVFSIVETAESEPNMSLGEKSMLSSLLVAVLLRNFQYCTDVVLSLLRAHIAKSVHAGSSDILFRKSDSVVEKMVAKWLTICLYDPISQFQANKYNTLFKALKYQTERGPVDAVTGNARYTINEAKLLREIVDCSYVDCLVTNLDGRGPYTVRAIACDTISQLKQKILDHVFKRTPHSQRPAITSFDLELICPSRGRVLLSDYSGSNSLKGPTKLNTLSHYSITNNSCIAIVPSEKGVSNYRATNHTFVAHWLR
ncbi:IPT/TIG domain protein [Oesophagostomum dentatum]|uniref:IPT/TIG domain protein n=1 Tax=Oesophagostomum dentatum TaxID=61180 RepID=A0A0B1ST49_OESDE|nr:IPT/TIG domain protein [Oesophagostomum dentatum]